MENNEIQILTKDERTFLHEIATPIATATLVVDILMEGLKARGTEEEMKHLDMLQKSLEKTKDLIQSRRQILIERSEK